LEEDSQLQKLEQADTTDSSMTSSFARKRQLRKHHYNGRCWAIALSIMLTTMEEHRDGVSCGPCRKVVSGKIYLTGPVQFSSVQFVKKHPS
jgi:hypothetical protein